MTSTQGPLLVRLLPSGGGCNSLAICPCFWSFLFMIDDDHDSLVRVARGLDRGYIVRPAPVARRSDPVPRRRFSGHDFQDFFRRWWVLILLVLCNFLFALAWILQW